MPIRIEIIADTTEELAHLVRGLTPLAKLTNPVVTHSPPPNSNVAMMVTVEPMDGGDEASDVTAEPEPEVAPPVAKKTKAKKAEAPVEDKPDLEKVREVAIAKCHELFNANPETAKKVVALRDTFKIKKFIDLPLERVLEFKDAVDAIAA